jgi:hypothetical protein
MKFRSSDKLKRFLWTLSDVNGPTMKNDNNC